MINARSDVVGSLLRPPELLDAREAHERGEIGAAAFKQIEDAAVDRMLDMQERAGLDVVTDGEMRRLSFQSQVVAALDGFGDWDMDAFLWGHWEGDGLEDMDVERPDLAVVQRLRRRRYLTAEEFTYARGRTDGTVKVTLPSPSLFASFYDPDRAPDHYPHVQSFLDHLADLLREEVEELARLGATYVQIDAPHYPMFVDPAYRDFYASRGIDPDQWIEFGIELDNRVISGGNRSGEGEVTSAFHLCRGNQASRWLVSGGYDWLAGRIFPRIEADRLLLEYDDERSGGFEPLADVPEDKRVVLGLVTTKTGRLEPLDELVGRVEEAASFFPKDHLAVSPQCGFATSVIGNELTEDDQQAKLHRVGELAEAIWG